MNTHRRSCLVRGTQGVLVWNLEAECAVQCLRHGCNIIWCSYSSYTISDVWLPTVVFSPGKRSMQYNGSMQLIYYVTLSSPLAAREHKGPVCCSRTSFLQFWVIIGAFILSGFARMRRFERQMRQLAEVRSP